MDQVAHVDVAGCLDHGSGKLCLFILNRDLSKSHDVEIVWEDAAPGRFVSGSILTGDDLKASNSFESPNKISPKTFTVSPASGNTTKLAVPARSYAVMQWST
jgi:alpha-L-arabinofuranosidase